MPSASSTVGRRGVVARLAAAGAAGVAAFGATKAVAAADDIPRVAYHLSDRDKVQMVLGNIANHVKGFGGPDKVRIALVVNGPALLAFKADKADEDLIRRLHQTAEWGVELGACGNTLDAQTMTVAELLPGFVRVDEGGVVRLHKLQAAGWAYIRP